MKTYATAKIQGARVTDAHLEYEGSVTIGAGIADWAGIEAGELVHINNLENGSHWETYVILGEGTELVLNGPPACVFSPGDRVVVVRYELLEERPEGIQVVTVRDGRLYSSVVKPFQLGDDTA